MSFAGKKAVFQACQTLHEQRELKRKPFQAKDEHEDKKKKEGTFKARTKLEIHTN